LQQVRDQQHGTEFHQSYAKRAGIEGTHSQAVRAFGLRRTRYFGLAKTSLQHYATAAVINLIRLDAFLSEKKAAKTRTSRFAAIIPDELAS
jgi:transposase